MNTYLGTLPGPWKEPWTLNFISSTVNPNCLSCLLRSWIDDCWDIIYVTSGEYVTYKLKFMWPVNTAVSKGHLENSSFASTSKHLATRYMFQCMIRDVWRTDVQQTFSATIEHLQCYRCESYTSAFGGTPNERWYPALIALMNPSLFSP